MRFWPAVLVCLIPIAPILRAQSSRAEEIQSKREEKAQQPAEQKPSAVLGVVASKEFVEAITRTAVGWRLRMGGLVSGAGFAVGPEYFRILNQERLLVRGSAVASAERSYLVDAAVSMPRLAGGRGFLDFLAVRRGLSAVDYYGPGPDSSKSGRTAFLMEDAWFSAQGGMRVAPRTRVGGLGRYGMINTGPGRDARFASTERVYSESDAPGVTRQSNYAVGGAFADYDWRDSPFVPRRGGYYLAEFSYWSDRKLGRGSFGRLNLDVQQYVAFLNERRVIMLRGRGSFTDSASGQFVPFYLQPTLGGSNDLRGFRSFRFHDNNALVLNAEYRWALFTGLDMALFADAGKVFRRWQEVDLTRLQTSFGFGFRANLRDAPFLRIDTGFSREGFQVWVKFAGFL